MLPRHWTELGRAALESGALADAVAVLPLAAVEQHGPHLPLGVDRFIMQAHLDALLAAAPTGLPFVLLPVQDVGASDEHLAFPGTLTLTPALALPAWTALGEGVHRAGCRRIVLVSSHGGNTPVMELVAQALRVRLGMVAVTTSWQRLGTPDGLPVAAESLAHDWHGGFAETSVMLACRPDLVRMELAGDFPSRGAAMEREHAVLRATRPAGFAWMAQDLHPSGALGNAGRATAEAGRALVAHAAGRFVALLDDVRRFSL